ncbi:MAG: methyl-accepting chemotaxis protein [Candidatus Contendobacter sp.]|nr:methyl-accepting chemotaxis protein [Candidatus Contendobacter sp.]
MYHNEPLLRGNGMVNFWLDMVYKFMIGGERALLDQVANQLKGCDLNFSAPSGEPETEMSRRLTAGFGNLSEAIRQAAALSVQIAEEVPHITSENGGLATQSQAQMDALTAIFTATQRLLDGLQGGRDELREVIDLAKEANRCAQAGSDAARELATAMTEVESRSVRAHKIVEVIDTVAFQTNILSINARIEAAHAGELGQGFAVIAQEIRQLAVRTATAARDVRGIIGETSSAVSNGARSATATQQVLTGLGELMTRAGVAMESMAERVTGQGQELVAIDHSLKQVLAIGRNNLENAGRIAERSEALQEATDTLRDCVGLFRLPEDPLYEIRHATVFDLATASASAVSTAFAAVLHSGAITAADLFSSDYQPIPGTQPPKHHTPFDRLCDELLPPIQEPAAASQPWIVYAICANYDGYVPTHNLRFAQPLTGDQARDLVGNRTKRIFDDRVGRSVGSHTDPYRLQVYRRDTGEIMFDLSVPIFVGDEHWGGFRVGYALA